MNTQEYISSGVLEAYILGTASHEEAGILECVMSHNAEVRAAFEETQKILEDLATAQAVKPADDLRDKIWLKISENKLDITPVSNQDEEIRKIPLPAEISISNSESGKSLFVLHLADFDCFCGCCARLFNLIQNLFYQRRIPEKKAFVFGNSCN